jgi:hypothetical protein
MMNSGVTLVDVRSEAMAAIQKLKANEIDVKTAGEIRNLLGVIIDTAKTQVEFLKAIPNSVKEQMQQNDIKAIAGTLRDRDAELDATITEIEENRTKSYLLSQM